MTSATEILQARSKRAETIKHFLSDTQSSALSIKTNVPGTPKNGRFQDIVLKVFHHLFRQLLEQEGTFYASMDGDYVLFSVADAFEAKKLGVYLENHHPLGAFVDADVYTLDNVALHRADLGYDARKCWLCGCDARECARGQTHEVSELRDHMRECIERFLVGALSREALQALRKEVFLYPSLALVSARDTGRHTDMNISHFLASIEALQPYIEAYLKHGLRKSSLRELRDIGKDAESAMLDATGGVNTHKGANFIFGLILFHYGRAIIRGEDLYTCMRNVSETAKRILQADFSKLPQKERRTRGETLFAERNVKGIRGEAANGFPAVFSWYPRKDHHVLRKFAYIASRLEDTTLICGDSPSLHEVKESMRKAQDAPCRELRRIFQALKKQGCSPGGAADLLALVFFLEATDVLLESYVKV